ncbi:hypothetical protein [Mesorhizobium sp. ES1-4]|uniref:hypothetical protein n=1 Tax=Mesorhizobium sp. ES1-4 TaxID=2876627 RepID=UPI001CCC3B10|nr:hypothetical protein [Mesorhizobium sp. ES1-4]MBZ9799776.1 hypothetical protein [Mesorhizobium sp. ES1-4]
MSIGKRVDALWDDVPSVVSLARDETAETDPVALSATPAAISAVLLISNARLQSSPGEKHDPQ